MEAVTDAPERKGFVERMERGKAAYAAGRWEEASEEYGEACRLDPDSARSLCELGRALARLRRPDEAIKRFEAALQRDPRHHSALYHLAMCLDAQLRYAEAVPAYERFLANVTDETRYVESARVRLAELKIQLAEGADQR